MSPLFALYRYSVFGCQRNGRILLRNYFSSKEQMKMTLETNRPSETSALFRGQTSEVYIQVVQSGCPGYGKCLYMFTTNRRYLINCPEGASRHLTLTTNKFGILDNVFVTRDTWSNIGGLPGFAIMKRQSAGLKKVPVYFHGPEGMDKIFTALKCIYDEGPPVDFIEKSYKLEKYEDETLVIDYAPLFGENKKKTREKARKNEEYEKITETDENDVSGDDRDVSVAYLFKLKPKPGHLDALKCMKAGVPRGPLLGELAKGNDVVLADGRTVKSSDVTSEPEPVPSFAVVDIGDEYFLDSLINSKKFDHLFDEFDQRPTISLDLLIHLTPENIFRQENYQNWMKKFGSRTRHLILNSSAPFLPHNEGAFRVQSELNYVDSDLFPLLQCHKHNSFNDKENNLNNTLIYAEPSLKYHFRPHKGFVRDETVFDKKIHVDKLLADEEFVQAHQWYKNELKLSYQSRNSSQTYPEVVFTGTGSACPTKIRNVSGILLNVTDYHAILLDCGEGTYSQLYELYGPEEIDRILSNIKLIFISHLHADHHMGLFTLMMKRKEAFERLDLNFEPVYIIGPVDLFRIQSAYSENVEDILPMARKIYNTLSRENEEADYRLINARKRLNLKSLSLVKVLHPRMARAIVLRLADGKKIVYSGDTRPCDELIQAGKDADLLIHEATFDEELYKEAVAKKHCTLTEAQQVSKEMNAKYTIFTHFSGRYPRLPIMTNESAIDAGIAFDYMKIPFSRMNTLSKTIPVLKLAFREHEERMMTVVDLRKAKRFREDFERTKSKSKSKT